MCMADYCDGYSIVLRDRNHRARKTHRCSECYRDILAGENYNVMCCIFDDSMDIYKTCQHCQIVKSWLQKQCGGYLFQGVYEDIDEHRREGYGFGVVRLASGMRHKWKRKDGRIYPIPKMPKITENRHR